MKEYIFTTSTGRHVLVNAVDKIHAQFKFALVKQTGEKWIKISLRKKPSYLK